MLRPGSPNVATIVQALKMNGATVDGPTERGGELVYRINEHTLTENEILSLAGRRSPYGLGDLQLRPKPPSAPLAVS